jgi:hypothetical protein
MNDIPPIPKHEFFKRFYAVKTQNLLYFFRLYRRKICKGHSSEALSLFPQKVSILDENSVTREFFWGIYAREEICLCWVLFYNFICVLPTLAFFFVWLFKACKGEDMQDSSIPFTMMTGMLSIFWSVFLSSLQFGKQG